MKKTLLLSVVASTMMMAGGDIAPVVVAPVVEEVSGWDFSGQAVVYYQTRDSADVNLFEQEGAAADAGIQLRAINKDVFAGIGMGFEVNGLSTLNLENAVVDNVMQGVGNIAALGNDIDDVTDGGWVSQAYLTYGFGNTSLKLGRQELPKALSPFAFSEHWNVFANTFDAVLIVNTDISNTTLVGAWVAGANHNGYGAGNNLTDFNSVNDDDGIYMLTAQNKSIDGLTLTGTGYFAAGQGNADDTTILWGDAKYNAGSFNVAGQVGTIMSDDLDDDAVAFGAKIGTNLGMFNASVAYSSTDENAAFKNKGGVKTPLYTQMILNQGVIMHDADYIKAAAGVKALGGKFGIAYGYAINNNDDDTLNRLDNNPYELDVTYKTKVFNDSTTLFAGYVLTDADIDGVDSRNLLRFWGRYNF